MQDGSQTNPDDGSMNMPPDTITGTPPQDGGGTFTNQDNGASLPTDGAPAPDGTPPEDGSPNTDPSDPTVGCQNDPGHCVTPDSMANKGPIILNFDAGSSLSTVSSLVIGAGVSLGTVSLPLTRLSFTCDNLATADLLGIVLTDNQTFYSNTYSNLPLANQSNFYGDSINRGNIQVGGVAIGENVGSVLSEAGDALTTALKSVFGQYAQVYTGITDGTAQSSQSGNSLLHGMNGRDTYNMDISELDVPNNLNVLILQFSAGAITQVAVNLMFIGPFPSILQDVNSTLANPSWIDALMPTSVTFTKILLKHYSSIFSQSIAWAVVPDAAVGVIAPGIQLGVLYS